MARAKRMDEQIRPQDRPACQNQPLPSGAASDAVTTHTERGFKHPTGGSPKSVILIGLGPSHHDYDQAWLNPHTPDVLWQADEVWIINRGLFNIQHDLAWVMDFVEGEANNFPVYGAKLWNHDKPIITSERPDDWPGHVHRYPFEEIWSWQSQFPKVKWTDCYGTERESVGPPAHQDWLHNSVPYIINYAAWLGVKIMYTWGLDYHHHKSGRVEDGHVNCGYWTGCSEFAGMKIVPYDQSTFLNANQRGYIYGYPPGMDPRPIAVSRRAAFRRFAGLDKGAEYG